MKAKLIHVILVLGSLGSIVGNSAGHELGNPLGFIHETDDTAWFADERRSIHVCYVANPEFGVDDAALSFSIQNAFLQWKGYINRKKVRISPEHSPVVGTQLATELVLLPQCDGTEDLKVYFGVSDEAVEKYRPRAENEVGFAVRTAYNVEAAWGKGFIWIAPPHSIDTSEKSPSYPFPEWTRTHILDAVLLHEVGHIFGVGHIEGTIMRSDLARWLYVQTARQNPSPETSSIDAEAELVVCETCGFEYQGEIPHWSTDSQSAPKTFETVMGRPPVGNMFLLLRKPENQPVGSGIELMLGDSRGARRFALELFKTPIARNNSIAPRVFRRFKRYTVNGVLFESRNDRRHESYVLTGTLKTVAGAPLTIFFERNGATWRDSPVALGYLSAEGPKPLFTVPRQ